MIALGQLDTPPKYFSFPSYVLATLFPVYIITCRDCIVVVTVQIGSRKVRCVFCLLVVKRILRKSAVNCLSYKQWKKEYSKGLWRKNYIFYWLKSKF